MPAAQHSENLLQAMRAIRGPLTPSFPCFDALLVSGEAAICSRQRRSWRCDQCHGEDELLSCGIADLVCGSNERGHILSVRWRAAQQVAFTSTVSQVV
jgi:hypothetical protein